MRPRRFRQHDRADCGVACLAYVAHRHGLQVPLAHLRLLLPPTARGVSARQLMAAAETLQFATQGVRGEPAGLAGVPLPAIAHCLVGEARAPHYIVLEKWKSGYARVMDPAVGRPERWPRERFAAVWTGVLILLAPAAGFQPGDRTRSPWRRLGTLLRPHAPALWQALIGALVSTVLALATSVYVQKLVDHVIPDANRALLHLLGLALAVILLLRWALGVGQALLSLRVAQRIDAALMLAYYRHLLRLPPAFFNTMRVGEMLSRLGDAVKIRHFLHVTLLNLLLHPLILLFAVGAMFFYSSRLAWLSLGLVPLQAALYALLNRLNREHQRRIMERGADLEAHLVESLGAHALVRGYGLREVAGLATERRLVRVLRSTWRAALAGLSCHTAGGLLSQAYLLALLWLGAERVLASDLTLGELMSCYTLAAYLTGPLVALLGSNTEVQEALIAVDRLFEVMDLECEDEEVGMEVPAGVSGDLRCEQVAFGHLGRAPVLNGISLVFPAGRITALAGPSGCGKSTLLALLQRNYPPTQGRILWGEDDLRYFRLEGWRRRLAVVPQQANLLAGSIVDNLAPGETAPDMERVLAACRVVGAIEFIEALPQGFLTCLHENGLTLSGGQRQRLALARAFYRDAAILLLDEPSSALDARAEEQLAQALLRERTRGKTIVLASHHPRLLAIADQIVHLDRGRVGCIERPGVDRADGLPDAVGEQPR